MAILNFKLNLLLLSNSLLKDLYDYIPLRISTVKPIKSLTIDLNILFKEQYLCYVEKGEQLTEDKYTKLKIQKVAFFLLQRPMK